MPIYTAIVADFDARCANDYDLVELTSVVVERARVLLERHPLRAHDAIQLASALAMQETLLAVGLDPITFLSADERLLAAAHAEELMGDNFNNHYTND